MAKASLPRQIIDLTLSSDEEGEPIPPVVHEQRPLQNANEPSRSTLHGSWHFRQSPPLPSASTPDELLKQQHSEAERTSADAKQTSDAALLFSNHRMYIPRSDESPDHIVRGQESPIILRFKPLNEANTNTQQANHLSPHLHAHQPHMLHGDSVEQTIIPKRSGYLTSELPSSPFSDPSYFYAPPVVNDAAPQPPERRLSRKRTPDGNYKQKPQALVSEMSSLTSSSEHRINGDTTHRDTSRSKSASVHGYGTEDSMTSEEVEAVLKDRGSACASRTLPSIAQVHQRFGINPGMMFSIGNYTTNEDEMLIYLKEEEEMTWADIERYFPWRKTWHRLQSRYSGQLKGRGVSKPAKANLKEGQFSSDPALRRFDRRRDHPKRTVRDTGSQITYRGTLGSADENMTMDDDEVGLAEYKSTTAQLARSRGILFHGEPRDGSLRFLGTREEQSQKVQYDVTRIARNRAPPVRLKDKIRIQLQKDRDQAGLASLMKRVPRLSTIEKATKQVRTFEMRLRLTFKPAIELPRPYLCAEERKSMQTHAADGLWDGFESSKWDGRALHVDFSDEELEVLERSIVDVVLPSNNSHINDTRTRIRKMLTGVTEINIRQISECASHDDGLLNRSRASIESYLWDASKGACSTSDSTISLKIRGNTRISSTNSILRFREGLAFSQKAGLRTSSAATLNRLIVSAGDTLGPFKTYTGTSGDVGTLAWSPNGEIFAAGSAALMDDASMQYNLPNNLVLGHATTGVLQELPDHAIRRRIPGDGVNAVREMHISQDLLLFTTISAVRFSLDGKFLFTAGYDNCARVWDVKDAPENLNCVRTYQHADHIDLLEATSNHMFATGAKIAGRNSVQVVTCFPDGNNLHSTTTYLSSELAISRPDAQIIPTCLRWGSNFLDQDRYLICGFAPPDGRQLHLKSDAEICLWDVTRPAQPLSVFHTNNPFDIAWSSSQYGRFAIGSLPGSQWVNPGTKSVVRIYDSRRLYSDRDMQSSIAVDKRCKMELECSALDMNDVVFNPFDDCLISVGCTDGCTYIWDLRMPDDLLHRFEHGEPVTELDECQPRELVDTGVRFISWGQSRRRLFTGSSDGVVKSWDPYLSPENAHVRDVVNLNSGVMSGAFNPEYSKLLLGEVNGSITLLSLWHDDYGLADAQDMTLQTAEIRKTEMRSQFEQTIPSSIATLKETGNEIARGLLQTGQIEIRPLGDFPVRQAVQGFQYMGPFDTSAEAPARRAKAAEFQRSFSSVSDPCILEHNLPKVTEEDQGDSRASATRIPDRLRYPDEKSPHAALKLGCFRCEALMTEVIDSKDGRLDMVQCYECQLAWRVDSLGFSEMPTPNGTRQPRRWKLPNIEDEEQDPANQVDYYYHSHWQA